MPTPESAIRAFLDHLAVERGVSKHTALAYRRDLARYAYYLAERRLSDLNAVTAGTISDYAGSLREGVREGDGWRQPPLAAASVARAVVSVRSLHRFAHSEGMTDLGASDACR